MSGGSYNPNSNYPTSSYGSTINSGLGGTSYGSSFGNSLGSNLGGTGYSSRYPYEQQGPQYGPYNPNNPNQQQGMGFGAGLDGHFNKLNGLFGMNGPDYEGKSSLLLPLAGAALLGVAAYALVANPMLSMGPAIGKRRKRSTFEDKLVQHLAYRSHKSHAK